MNLSKIDRYLAEEIMHFQHMHFVNYYDHLRNRELIFTPTTDLKDAFKLIYRLQDQWAWSIQMNNLECEVEVQFGTGYYSDKFLPKAICIAVLKHFKVDLKQFEN